MHRALIIAATLVGSGPAVHASIDRDALLAAIAEVETGHNHAAVGAAGERGAWQITRAVWRSYTNAPFKHAHEPALSREVAMRHLDHLYWAIERTGHRATPWTIAVAWNAGLDAALTGRIPRSTRDYAHRVANLYSVHCNK